MQYQIKPVERCAGCKLPLSEAPARGPKMLMEIRWYPPSQNQPVSVCSIGCLGTLALTLGVAQQEGIRQARALGVPGHLLGEGRP